MENNNRIITNSKVLVTGADGFIGSHLTEMLLEKGYKVRALYQYNSFNYWGWLEDIPQNNKDFDKHAVSKKLAEWSYKKQSKFANPKYIDISLKHIKNSNLVLI